MDEHFTDIKNHLDEIEINIANNNEKFRDQIRSDITDIIEKCRKQMLLDVMNILEKSRYSSPSKKDKSVVTEIMERYIDDHYVKTNIGKVATTSFNEKIIEFLKDEGYTVGVKGIPYLMTYVFGFDKVKTCGDWYYTGLEEKPNRHPKLVVLQNH